MIAIRYSLLALGLAFTFHFTVSQAHAASAWQPASSSNSAAFAQLQRVLTAELLTERFAETIGALEDASVTVSAFYHRAVFRRALALAGMPAAPQPTAQPASPCALNRATTERPVAVTVTDASGARVPGASVVLSCGDWRRDAVTGVDGVARVLSPEGRVDVRVELWGFDPAVTQAIVGGDTPATVDVLLPTGQVLQAIEVTGRAPEDLFAGSSFAATKTETHVLDIPQSVSTVTKEVIEDQNLRRLNEIAPYVAGVNEFSVYNDLTIRGFRNSDDRRVNGMRAYNDFWSQPLIAHLERVEVIKGPASATFGDASPGGTVNMVTKKPLATGRHELVFTTGEHGQRTAALDTTGPLGRGGRVLYRLNVAGEYSDSFRNQSFNEGLLVAPSISVLPARTTRINLDVVRGTNHSVLDRGQPNVQGARRLGQVPITVMVTQPGDRLDTTTTSTMLSVDQRLNDRWNVAGAYSRYDYNQTLQEHGLNRYLTPTLIELYYVDRVAKARVESGTAYATGVVSTGSVYHRLLAGIDLSQRRNEQSQTAAEEGVGTFDLLSPQYVSRDPSRYQRYSDDPWGGTLFTRGLYLQNQITVGRFRGLIGLRHERFETTPLGDPVQLGTALLPRAGVVFRVTDGSSLYASWIRGFEPPNSWLNSAFYGGPFDPMDSRLVEAGYKVMTGGDRLLMTASVYEIERNNVIVWANDESNPDLYYQRGQERSRGVELEATGRLSARASVIANYSFNSALVTDDVRVSLVGLTKENAPRQTATLWGRYDLGSGWGLGAGVVHVGARETFDRRLVLPSYTLLNGAVYYERDRWRISLLGKNLTDETHWTGGYNFGRTFPGAPRTVSLTAGLRF